MQLSARFVPAMIILQNATYRYDVDLLIIVEVLFADDSKNKTKLFY